MSDGHAATAAEHHDIEHHGNGADSTAEPWVARVVFGFGGLALLAGAFAAWHFKDVLGGQVGEALPWLIAAAVLLGGAAVVESIGTAVWIALIAGAFLLAITFVVAGRVATYPSVGQSVFVVDRFTGDVELCDASACKVLERHGTFLAAPQLPHALKGKLSRP